jgi:hypothetical protein
MAMPVAVERQPELHRAGVGEVGDRSLTRVTAPIVGRVGEQRQRAPERPVSAVGSASVDERGSG